MPQASSLRTRLLAVARGRLYRAYGCASLGEFAREWLGISPRKAEALVRLERTSLCVWHHQRGEHAKILRCRGKAPRELRFELGVRPGRAPLARYRSGDVLVE